MTQPVHDALPGDRQVDDRAFAAIISAPELCGVDVGTGHQEGVRRDIRRIASALFCSSTVDASIVSFAKQRTALQWDLTEDVVDVLISARLLARAARLMSDRQILAADLPVGLSDAA
jgi:hypothetical protein